jgi:hypothetical protein
MIRRECRWRSAFDDTTVIYVSGIVDAGEWVFEQAAVGLKVSRGICSS